MRILPADFEFGVAAFFARAEKTFSIRSIESTRSRPPLACVVRCSRRFERRSPLDSRTDSSEECRRLRHPVRKSNRSHATFEITDVSLVEGTIAVGNYWSFFTSPRNGIEEADGSIPFSSTESLRSFVQFRLKGRFRERLAMPSDLFRRSPPHEASRPPASSTSARFCCAPATASRFA